MYELLWRLQQNEMFATVIKVIPESLSRVFLEDLQRLVNNTICNVCIRYDTHALGYPMSSQILVN